MLSDPTAPRWQTKEDQLRGKKPRIFAKDGGWIVTRGWWEVWGETPKRAWREWERMHSDEYRSSDSLR